MSASAATLLLESKSGTLAEGVDPLVEDAPLINEVDNEGGVSTFPIGENVVVARIVETS